METPELPFPGHILGTWQVFLAVLEWQSIRSAAFHNKGTEDCWEGTRVALFAKTSNLLLSGV